MEEIYRELLELKNVRQNLSALRKWLKDGGAAEELKARIAGQEELFYSFLKSEDAKTRKNAALLFGDLCYGSAALLLYQAYEREETLFVRSAYLEALLRYPAGELQEESAKAGLKEQEERLQEALLTGVLRRRTDGGTPAQEPLGENKKHVAEELRALRQLRIRGEGIKSHSFDRAQGENRVLLITNRLHREVVRRLVLEAYKSCAADKEPDSAPVVKLHPLGVSVETGDLVPLSMVRAYRELCFLCPQGEPLVSRDPEEAAKSIAPWLAGLCRKYHGEGVFYFRMECRAPMTLEERSTFTRRLGVELEIASHGRLVNSPGDYEVELRLVMNREGLFFPCVKFYTLPDARFSYRKHAVSTSLHPSVAALIMELARPYLKEGAQLLDPFCGVGTLLIERDIAVPAGDKYGTDIFGDAIIFGRENAALAGEKINFIHRDFFDFRHAYRFDEIITDMPRRGKQTKEEMDALYEQFFRYASGLLAPQGVIIMYTNEVGFVKKQLRLHREYRLLQETLMQTKTGFSLMVIGLRG
ncbi:MAG: methyltransferase [Muribaculaceae bacterium]|nr:methyltransferase [Roseburia sp.]MCM1431314.1 methyltransferase [Muribaculaceae bacterium]MCM1492200.1 methyltransferase [Muribaculaceae bacterium]